MVDGFKSKLNLKIRLPFSVNTNLKPDLIFGLTEKLFFSYLSQIYFMNIGPGSLTL